MLKMKLHVNKVALPHNPIPACSPMASQQLLAKKKYPPRPSASREPRAWPNTKFAVFTFHPKHRPSRVNRNCHAAWNPVPSNFPLAWPAPHSGHHKFAQSCWRCTRFLVIIYYGNVYTGQAPFYARTQSVVRIIAFCEPACLEIKHAWLWLE